jgi:hypothetical protein
MPPASSFGKGGRSAVLDNKTEWVPGPDYEISKPAVENASPKHK